jgi:BirA family biotin operon repressor/biotin-[acetyl-CoA-carboxylase] ligase
LYNSIQDTLIIGKKVVYLPSCHSTNDIAAEIVHAGLFTEGTVVITDNQLTGRGQRGTSWVANPGENLTFSVILNADFLAVSDQFLVSQTIALAIRAYVATYLEDVKVKWPNDILVGRKKICGILIENSVQGTKLVNSIVGIGVNVNQFGFENGKATSLLKETGTSFVLTEEFPKLVRFLDAFYVRLKGASAHPSIRNEYLNHLYGYRQPVRFSFQDQIMEGEVSAVLPQGRLVIAKSGSNETFDVDLKEIQWIMD